MRNLLLALGVLLIICYVGPPVFAGIAMVLCGLLDFSADASVVLALLLTAGVFVFAVVNGSRQ